MPELSPYLNTYEEFAVLLALFFCVLLIDKRVRGFFASCFQYISKAFVGLRERSVLINDWCDSIVLAARDRSGFLSIVIALVAFSYATDYAGAAIFDWVRTQIGPAYSGLTANPYYIASYWVETIFAFFGYALFGWLAFQRARGIDFRKASTFRPYTQCIAFLLFVITTDHFAGYLFPHYIYIGQFDAEYFRSIALYMLISAAPAGIMFAIWSIASRPIALPTAVRALAGFCILSHFLMLHNAKFNLHRYGLPNEILITFNLASGFLSTIIGAVIFTAFCIMLGRAAAGTNDPQSVVNAAPHTE